MSDRVKAHVAPALATARDPIAAEGDALAAFLTFARDHKEIYRIVDEAEFVDPRQFPAATMKPPPNVSNNGCARARMRAQCAQMSARSTPGPSWA